MTEVFEKTACPGDSIAGAVPSSDSAGTMAAATAGCLRTQAADLGRMIDEFNEKVGG